MLSAMRTASLVILAGVSAVTASGTSFVLIGDSTTANGTTTNSGGWGNGFCASLASGTGCINTAKNGASTGSFVLDGYFKTSLAAIEKEIAVGRRTVVTLQFGHNDQKVGTPESMGTNLTAMVKQIRAAGGEPVLISSLTRRGFNSAGRINDTLQPWADVTSLTASQLNTPFLDLHRKSITYLEAIGADAAHRLNKTPDDNTHVNANGSTLFGRMVADLFVARFGAGKLPFVANAAITGAIAKGIAYF